MYLHPAGSKENVIEASLHPPHLIDLQENPTPAALIPFCAYHTTLLGQKSVLLPPFTFCSQFRPTLLEGQLCYLLNVSSLNQPKSKVGFNNGLMLVLDESSGYANHLGEAKRDMRTVNDIVSLELKPPNSAQHSTRIYLNNLASFVGYSKGSYMMSALKKMKGTKEFLDLADNKKGCSIETFEDCQKRNYFKKVVPKCGCIPWALSNQEEQKVH